MMGTENVKALLNPNLINSKIHKHTHTITHACTNHARVHHRAEFSLSERKKRGREGWGRLAVPLFQSLPHKIRAHCSIEDEEAFAWGVH